MNDLNKDTATRYGTGPKDSVLLCMYTTGIGDHVHAMPVVAQMKRDGYDVTVSCRPFIEPLWKLLGVKTLTLKEPFGMAWGMEHDKDYGRIISLKGWSTWHGEPQKSMFQYFAEIVGSEVPKEFSWIETLNPQTKYGDPYILFAPEAGERWRSLPLYKAQEIYDELSKEHNVLWLSGYKQYPDATGRKGFSREMPFTTCETFEELRDVVFNATLVVAVESGVLALATALRKETAGIYGMTGPEHIVYQFAHYFPVNTRSILGPPGLMRTGNLCNSPCYRLEKNGFTPERKCCDGPNTGWARCMEGIKTEDVVSLAEGIYV